ncbi:hypothetical protein MHI39_08145 [Heyndrickxia sp. FSL K6-6286]|uniref:hypothetical protein n=1 Tax=Heyndrickxia sp. FSL K6-6286 TaxID=2921510 RepID=UPI00315AC944
MTKRKGNKKMNATASKVYNLFDFNSNKKRKNNRKKLSSLSPKDMRESMEFRRKKQTSTYD